MVILKIYEVQPLRWMDHVYLENQLSPTYEVDRPQAPWNILIKSDELKNPTSSLVLNYPNSYLPGGRTTMDTDRYLVLTYPKPYLLGGRTTTDTDEYLVLKDYLKSYPRSERTATNTDRYPILENYAKSYLVGIQMTLNTDGCLVMKIPQFLRTDG